VPLGLAGGGGEDVALGLARGAGFAHDDAFDQVLSGGACGRVAAGHEAGAAKAQAGGFVGGEEARAAPGYRMQRR